LTRATTTTAARRGEMLVAISRGVVPAATSRTEPSGSWILIGLLTQTRIVECERQGRMAMVLFVTAVALGVTTGAAMPMTSVT